MGQIIVKKASGSTIPLNSKANLSIVSKAEHYKTLLGEDVLRISVQSSRLLDISVGDVVEVFGYVFTINATPLARKTGEHSFTYDFTFEGAQYDLLSVKYLDADVNNQIVDGGEFSLTSDLAGFLDVLVYNTRRKFANKWIIGTCPETEFKNLTFSSENCLAVLQRLCQEFNMEFDIELLAGNYVINIRKQGSVLPYIFEYGKGKGLYELTRKAVTDKNPVSVLYAFGGNRNIPSDYRNGARRLKLPLNDDSKIEDPAVVSSIGIQEGTVIFDDIFPKRIGAVSALGSNHLTFVDSSMDFDLTAKNAEGETLYLIAGSAAKIQFKTGNLAGYEFEVTSYNHATKTFTISNFTDERGQVFPDADSLALQISEGDKYVLLDIRMPQSYTDAAEAELQLKADEYYNENKGFHTQYELELDERFIKSGDGADAFTNFFIPGDSLHIKDSDLNVDKTLRLQSYVRDLVNPYKYKIVLSDSTVQSRIERLIADSVENNRTIKQNRLADPARIRRNWRTTAELTGMLETLRAEVALIGTDEGQFITDIFFIPNYNSNPNLFKTRAGQLIHSVYPIDNPGTWEIAAYEGTLSNAGAYYIYAKCSRTTSVGSILPSLERIGVEDDANFFHFPLGVLSSVSENARVLTSTYGYTLISGNNITTGIIQNEQSGITINLQTGEIVGSFKFSNGQLIEDVVADKNARYIGNTDPQEAWETVEEKRKHINDEWIRFVDDTTVSYFYTETSTNVFEWVPNQTQIDGGRITTGLIEAERINAEGLFSKAIVANNLDVQTGRVGGFIIASQLIGRSGTGALGLDPENKEVFIEDGGKKVVSIRQGGITDLLLFPSSQHVVTGTLKKYIETQKSRNDLLASPTVTLYVGYSSGQTFVKSTALLDSEKFSLGFAGKDTPYSANLPFNFDIIHSLATSDGRYNKLFGQINAIVNAELWVGTSLVDSKGFTTSVNLDSNDIDDRIFPRIVRSSITVNGAQKAYWKLSVQFTGDMRYRYYTHSTWFRSSSWTDMNSTPVLYRLGVDGGLSFASGIGITEIGSNGLQAYWNADRYFRIDGDDDTAFIRSAGTWMHNGYEVATSANINQITANLANYVLITDLQSAYYNRTESDGRYAKLAGGNSITGAQIITGDLTVTGNITQQGTSYITHAEEVFTKNDFITMREGATGGLAASALSGFKILKANGTANLVLGAGNDAIARVGWEGGTLQAIATRQDSPLSNGVAVWNPSASRFDTPYAITDFPRKVEAAIISGAWKFGNGTSTVPVTIRSSTGSRGIQLNASDDTKYGELGWNGTGFFLRNTSDVALIYVPWSSGYLGIGTASPSEKLHVAGNIQVDSSIKSSGHIYLTNTAPRIEFKQTDSENWVRWVLDGSVMQLQVLNYSDGAYLKAPFVVNVSAPSTALTVADSGYVGIGTGSPTAKLHVIGNILATSDLIGTNFISGFAGSGWKLDAADNHLTVDKLTVRGSMSVYELVINQIRATNGSLWVSDALKVTTISLLATNSYRLSFDRDNGNRACPFVVNDIIKAQRFDGRNVVVVVGKVTGYSSVTGIVDITTDGYTAPEGDLSNFSGLEFVRIGNTSDTNRQGALYLTSSDDGAPYMDILDGVNSGSTSGRTRLRVGKLSGISGQSGYGIWGSQDGVNEAFVISSAGYARIAGWNFNNYAIWKDNSSNFIGLNNSETESADGSGRIRRGFTLYRDDDAVGTEGLKIIRIGQLPVKDGTTLTGATTDYGIQIMEKRNSTNKDIFRVGNSGALIAGCNFNSGSIWSTGWRLNADGSGQFGGDKITWDASGNMVIAESLLVSSLIGKTLQSSNWNGTEGILFDLNGGVLTFGNSIDIDSVGGFINVKNTATQRTGVKIGDFSLTPVAGGGTSISIDISGTTTKYGTGAESAYVNQQGSISSTGAIQSSVVTLSSSLITGAVYSISVGFKFSFSRDTYLTELQRPAYEPSRSYIERNATLKVQLLDGNDVVLKTKMANLTSMIDGESFAYNIQMDEMLTATSTSLKIVWTINGTVLSHELIGDYLNNVTRDLRYDTKCVVSEISSTSKLIVTPNTSITELSAKGFQSLWGSSKYFRIFDDGMNPFISSAGYFKHAGLLEVFNNNVKVREGKVLTYNDWIYTSASTSYTIDLANSLKFEIRNTSSTVRTIYLPTASQIAAAIGSGTARFDVMVKCSNDSVGNIRLTPNIGVSFYNYNGGTMSYHEMGKGDSDILYFDGTNWNLFMNQT